jgi:uncharacterized membrane protein
LPWWEPWPLVASFLALAHWWQRQRVFPAKGQAQAAPHLLASLVLTAVLFLTLRRHLTGDGWLLATSLAAVITIVYGYITRAWAIAICGQVFAVVAVATFLTRLGSGHPSWQIALAPGAMLLATCALLSFAPDERWGSRVGGKELQPISLIYWCAGWAVLVAWVFDYVPGPWRCFTLASVAAALLLVAVWRRSQMAEITGLVLAALGYVAFASNYNVAPSIAELIGIILPPATLRLASLLMRREESGRQSATPDWVSGTFSVLVVGSVWLWATRWVHWREFHGTLTVIWSVVALLVLAAGFALRERIYRLGGLAILALALGRIFAVDVWQLETIYRILSFLTLGVVLLALGYLYNRFSDRIRKWL